MCTLHLQIDFGAANNKGFANPSIGSSLMDSDKLLGEAQDDQGRLPAQYAATSFLKQVWAQFKGSYSHVVVAEYN